MNAPSLVSPGPVVDAESSTLGDFYDTRSPDLFDKCDGLQLLIADLRARGLYQAQYRVEIEGPLDHHVSVRSERTGRVEPMVCFDSNGYLGLQRHPRVVAAVHRALDECGYGTPSAQLLSGTSRHLRELEDTVSAFFGREATLVFPSGYAANVGALTALLRPHSLVARDRLSHASLADGCRFSRARFGGEFAHLDMGDLESVLRREGDECEGKLVVTDGVFSMHASVAPLPELRALCDLHGARLMVDDAHGAGVLGETGRGIEEHWGMPRSVDVLMGSFSKAPGSIGGYVTGSRALIDYLRFFARSSMFTASLPAAICAGITESFRVMDSESEHRLALWRNSGRLWLGLRAAGMHVPETVSPVVTVFVGHERLLNVMSRELFDRGFKVGNVCFPAVPRGEAILRLSVSARHTDLDVHRVVDAVASLARAHGIADRTREEIRDIGSRVPLPTAASERPTVPPPLRVVQ